MYIRSMLIWVLIALFGQECLGQTDYEAWLEKDNQALQSFQDKEDAAFFKFLKKEWEAFALMQGETPLEKPKPLTVPKSKVKPLIQQSTVLVQDIQITPPPPAEKFELFRFERDVPESDTLNCDFYGLDLELAYPAVLKNISIEKPIESDQIAESWKTLSKREANAFIDQLDKLRTQLHLNDWGYYMVLKQIGLHLFDQDSNRTHAWIWSVLLKNGCDIKIGYDANHIFLLMCTEQRMYNTPFFMIDEKKYYAINLQQDAAQPTSIHSYKGNHSRAKNRMTLRVDACPVLGDLPFQTELVFAYQDSAFKIPVDLNQQIVNFYQQYPQTDFEVYFNAALDANTQYSLLSALKPLVSDKSETEAANLLLRFVQTAFGYQPDHEQFGKEKPLFKEETLYYNNCDCEDRSILFAFLVRQLLNLKVVGLYYPDHIATAILFTDLIEGDAVQHKSGTYLVCDPTYINANIGKCMPKLKDVRPEIIELFQ